MGIRIGRWTGYAIMTDTADRTTPLFHFNIVCSDFDPSYLFYTKVMGFKPALGRLASANPSRDSLPGEFGDSYGEETAELDLLDFRGNGLDRAAFLYLDRESGPYLDLIWFKQSGLVVPRRANDIGLARLCFVSTDIEADADRIRAADCPIVLPLCEITVAGRPYRCIVFRDPDGVMLEYIAERADP